MFVEKRLPSPELEVLTAYRAVRVIFGLVLFNRRVAQSIFLCVTLRLNETSLQYHSRQPHTGFIFSHRQMTKVIIPYAPNSVPW